jgi:phosphoglycolate phosphatase
MLDNYKAILFDFDYTLGDSSKGICESFNHALVRTGFTTRREQDICELIGLPLNRMFSALTQLNDEAIFERFREYYIEKADNVMIKGTKIYPGVPQLLKTLQLQGIKLGIVSTKSRKYLKAILVEYDLDHYFNIVIGGQDVNQHKPDPEGILLAINRLLILPNEVLYLGDTTIDAEAAKNACIHFIPVLSGKTVREEFRYYNPSHMLNKIEELLTLK